MNFIFCWSEEIKLHQYGKPYINFLENWNACNSKSCDLDTVKMWNITFLKIKEHYESKDIFSKGSNYNLNYNWTILFDVYKCFIFRNFFSMAIALQLSQEEFVMALLISIYKRIIQILGYFLVQNIGDFFMLPSQILVSSIFKWAFAKTSSFFQSWIRFSCNGRVSFKWICNRGHAL